MKTQFAWKEEFNIGVDVIDKEHKKLFKIINSNFPHQKVASMPEKSRKN